MYTGKHTAVRCTLSYKQLYCVHLGSPSCAVFYMVTCAGGQMQVLPPNEFPLVGHVHHHMLGVWGHQHNLVFCSLTSWKCMISKLAGQAGNTNNVGSSQSSLHNDRVMKQLEAFLGKPFFKRGFRKHPGYYRFGSRLP